MGDIELIGSTAPGPGSEISSCTLTSAFIPSGTGVNVVTGMSLVVPANSGPANIAILGAIYLSCTTGTNAASVVQAVRFNIYDELANLIAYNPVQYHGTGTSQTPNFAVSIGGAVANSSIDKTYHLEMTATKNGTSGGAAQMNAGGIFAPLVMQALRR